ncbi:hypothetical protein SAMN02800692_2021 [Luteibacter sp. UNC138MFCol5.1]|uniref:hypothetical protein n=1 Tax=Luteibacter sp. UNC138MFCol5.1 TaxID=1502774 RepID=UPI0008B91A28|nr:hypothetical protein [Luteibacter sp. UNC138MFCol5.1]SEO76817.1 hypothetical protein SAMN02800692_2021 [Luteibacter sp. UNC138MFCol5.1]
MDAKTYFVKQDGRLSREGKELRRVADFCEVSPYYLYMVVTGHKHPSPELAANLEHATHGQVDRRVTLPTFRWDAPTRTRPTKKAA